MFAKAGFFEYQHWDTVSLLENEEGPAHGKLFTCSVQIEVAGITYVSCGDPKSRVKDAESSAACTLLNALRYQELK
ncbi:hypothetical protein ACLOJK_037480 [Asimina triloba]